MLAINADDSIYTGGLMRPGFPPGGMLPHPGMIPPPGMFAPPMPGGE